MKVDPRATSFAATATPEPRPFREVLARAPAAPALAPVSRASPEPGPAPASAAAVLPRPAPARTPAEDPGAVAAWLLSRVEEEAPEPRTRKLLELITQELAGAQEGGPSAAANDLPFYLPGGAPPADDPRQQHLERSAAAVALIEKIQVFVRHGQRPVLALTLDNALAARVEIERMGPGRVALRMVGHRGPPCPEAVSRVRDELLARGLKVAAISVA